MRLSAALFWASLFAAPGQTPPEFRLSSSVQPTRYYLDLTIRPAVATYRGAVEIDLDLREAASVIWLNAKDLDVTEAWVESSIGRQSAKWTLAGGELLGLTFDHSLAPGRAKIGVRFTGKLDDKTSVGVYRRTENSNWYVFTSFTAIDARRAFPCFDQPEFKTPWKLTLHVPENETAVANSRAVSEINEPDGMKKVNFAETKPIASEVVAFGVGPFDIVEDGVAGKNSVPVRIIAPHGRGGETVGVRGASREIVARLEEYTGIPYMWDKLDHLALLDMPFGAIENPGLITFRDRILLAKPERDTAEHRQSSRGTMAHELAHQWFGNLVTQRWWNDVWLSEGFASWLGAKISDLELPESQRGVAELQSRARIMTVDNRPVRLEMHSRKEMDQVYSGIVYQKGAGVLRMVEHWVGEQPFRRGLQRYLRAHAYGTATTADLAAALNEETHADVAAVFESYLNQPGFPVLNVKFECGEKKARVVQESKLSWNTPVCTRGGCTVIRGAQGEVPVEGCPAWVNAAGAGYYRVQSDSLMALARGGWDQWTAPERLDFVEDVASLPAAEQITLLPALVRDRNPQVLSAVERIALRLALTPGLDVAPLRKMGW